MRIKDNKIFIPLRKMRYNARLNMLNFRGWSTYQKLVVIESDDWGSIRTASPEAYQALLKAGDRIDQDPFTRYDALESEDDLELLFELLGSFRDRKGNHPVFTANCAVANPDFDRIAATQYREYHFEPFTETFKRYNKHHRCFALWQSGLEAGLFFPQLHCREHVNISKWLQDLQSGNEDLLLAFANHMISGGNSFTKHNIFAYMDAFHYCDSENDQLLESIITDAAVLFKNILGYATKSFVPSCYVWPRTLERILLKHKIDYIQGGPCQFIPNERDYGQFDRKRHILGERNEDNQVYLIRNCSFEPSLGSQNAVELCLAQIGNAFRWRKPAIISTHRVNYVGYLDSYNRDRNLPLLKKLLTQILNCWPDVEFITSVELGDRIAASN